MSRTMMNYCESSIAKSDELGDKNNYDDESPSQDVSEYLITSFTRRNSSTGNTILRTKEFKELSDLLQQKYLNMKREFPVECCNIFSSYLNFRIHGDNRVYLYESAYDDILNSEIINQHIVKCLPLNIVQSNIVTVFYKLFNEHMENEVSYMCLHDFCFFTFMRHDEILRGSSYPEDFRAGMHFAFHHVLSNVKVPYFDRVLLLNDMVLLCICLYENWFCSSKTVHPKIDWNNTLRPHLLHNFRMCTYYFAASDHLIERYDLNKIFEPLKDFIVPCLYRRLFVNPSRIGNLIDILTKGIGKEFDVEESDSNFTIEDHDKFDSLVAKVRDEVVTDEYMKVSDKWAIMDSKRLSKEISLLTSDKCVVWLDVDDRLYIDIQDHLREISGDVGDIKIV